MTLSTTLLDYLVNTLWQAPLILAAAWLAARVLRSHGPQAEHRVWVAALAAQTLLPALSLVPWRSLVDAFLTTAAQPDESGDVAVQIAAQTAHGGIALPAWAISGLVALYALAVCYCVLRFAWQWARLRSLRRDTSALPVAGSLQQTAQRVLDRFEIQHARIAVSRRIAAPVTLGWRRPLLLLPPEIGLNPEQLEQILAHECAHIARRDFAKNLVYEFLSLPLRFHPAAWPLRARITETREMICDQLAAGLHSRADYGRTLLQLAARLAESGPLRVPQAIGIFDTSSLERRIMNLARQTAAVSTPRRLAAIAFTAALAAATCALTLGMPLHVAAETASSKADKPVQVAPGKILENIDHKVPPVYPADAKKARIQGTIRLKAIIGKDGTMQSLHVISGPKQLQQSALDAVKQWTYRPYLVNGEPVDVETEIKVIYSLGK